MSDAPGPKTIWGIIACLAVTCGLVLFVAGPLSDHPEPARPDGSVVGKVIEGAEMIGKPAPQLDVRWLDGKPDTKGKVVLVRWWTDGCPLCSNSAPAIAALQTKYGDNLRVLAVFHDKVQRRTVGGPQLRDLARIAGYAGAILGHDEGWRALRKWWLDAGERKFTSVTFLLGKSGRVRMIHTGGEFHAQEHTQRCQFDPTQCAAEYEAIDRMIDRLIAE